MGPNLRCCMAAYLFLRAVGTCFGTEKWCVPTGINLVVVVAGVIIASYGEGRR